MPERRGFWHRAGLLADWLHPHVNAVLNVIDEIRWGLVWIGLLLLALALLIAGRADAAPLPPDEGGTGAANPVTATITNTHPITLTGGGTLLLNGHKATFAGAGTVALLNAAQTFTATQSFQSSQSNALLGANEVANGDFATDLSGWSTDGWSYSSGAAAHVVGDSRALTQSISVVSGEIYHVEFDIVGRTEGYVLFDVGGIFIYDYGTDTSLEGGDTTRSFVAGSDGVLSITPSTNFDGAIDNISIRIIDSAAAPNIIFLDDDGDAAIEVRGDAGSSNSFFGRDAGLYNTTGSYNSFFGLNAGLYNTTGSSNSFFGRDAGLYNTTGSSNSFFGFNAGYDNQSGYDNTIVGENAGRGLESGHDNTILGANVTVAADLSNNIILADGDGKQRIRILENGRMILSQEEALTEYHLDGDQAGAVSMDWITSTTDAEYVIQLLSNGVLTDALTVTPSGLEVWGEPLAVTSTTSTPDAWEYLLPSGRVLEITTQVTFGQIAVIGLLTLNGALMIVGMVRDNHV
jgi:hypothetical protein